MITKTALLYLSRQEGVKDVLTRMSFFQKMTSRFVAGETIEDAAKVVHELNNRNISASFDHLGESIKNEAEAGAEVLEYSRILERISAEKLRSGVSIKPTQLGLDINL